ncbi:MAG: Fe-S cluster assembly ATPase SufC [Candidatus Marsarchaeota archaeon]|nr:Fe-S cluster assembly ATPase SufC [Candidatus Marsarchaeota archaeon]MCL5094964.1 Fe-S cluster assembly ATPase SufC [Candidatus Marsarchaeota archaeon]
MGLEIKNLDVKLDGREILKKINLNIKKGELHVIMGPNGSGKTTLAKAIMGYQKLKLNGKILLDHKDITDFSTDKRARLGLFLQFQNPAEIKDIRFINFMYNSFNSIFENTDVLEMERSLKNNLKILNMNENVLNKNLNFGFSGGEKKKMEILQMMALKPKFAMLDEPDSGLDVDAIKVIADIINNIIKTKQTGIILITHYNKMISYLNPNFIHILIDGKIIKSGKKELAQSIEKYGFEKYKNK